MSAHVGFITESFLESENSLFEGGAERVLYRLASLAKRVGVNTTIYQPGPNNDILEFDGLRVIRQPVRTRSLTRTLVTRALSDGCTHLHFQNLERVPRGLPIAQTTAHSHGVYWDFPYVPAYRAWYPSRLVMPATLALWRRLQKVRALRNVGRCRAVLCADSTLLRIVQSDAPALRTRLEVALNFSDVEASPPTTTPDFLKEMQSSRDNGRIVVFVPRNLSLARGGAWLIEILTDVLQTHRVDCAFFVAGAPVPVYGLAAHYTRNIQTQLENTSPGVAERLRLLGGVPHKSMAAAYQLADIVLVPTFAYEACSLAVLEAMACSRAVVATNIGGLNDAIADGVTGLLVAPEVSAIAVALACLAKDPDYRIRLATEAQRQVASRFTLPVWEDRIERFMVRAGWIRNFDSQRA